MFKSSVIMAACATSIANAAKLNSQSSAWNRQRLYMYMNDPQAAAQTSASSLSPVNQATNTWVQPDFRSQTSQPEPRNLVGKLRDFPIQEQVARQSNLFTQSQIEERLQQQRQELEAKFQQRLADINQEQQQKIAQIQREREAANGDNRIKVNELQNTIESLQARLESDESIISA